MKVCCDIETSLGSLIQKAVTYTGWEQLTPSHNIKALSVHYLVTKLIPELEELGYDLKTATIYNILEYIQKKGKDVTCPHDKQTGAAYVDCVEGKDNVGVANVMLSYTWGYRIEQIVHTIVSKCKKDGFNLKRTYVWMCCFNNNQHRVSELGDVPFEDFRKIFFHKVTCIGTIWSMMSPWNDPGYLKRVWCVFEIFVANTENGVSSEIIMPEEEQEKLVDSLLVEEGITNLFDVLSSTKIENAVASRPQDKANILKLVEDDFGYTELNIKVNKLLRDWILGVLLTTANKKRSGDTMVEYADKVFNVARAVMKLARKILQSNCTKSALTYKKKC